MAATPPPPLSSPQAFRLPPLPAFRRRPSAARDSLSASFSLGPDSLLDHLQLAPGTPAATGADGSSLSFASASGSGLIGPGRGGAGQQLFEQGANNSSLLPCSPRITTLARASRRPPPTNARRAPRPSSSAGGASFDLSGAGGADLSALQLGRSPAAFSLGAGAAAGRQRHATAPARSAGAAAGRDIGTPPVRSRLRFGRAPPDSSPAAADDDDDESSAAFAHVRSGLGAELETDEIVDADGDDVLLDAYDGADEGEGDGALVEKMRMWRHDAMLQHLYETAAFWGDKVLTWTGDKNDAFWLAQIHFLTTHYSRALRLLLAPLRPARPAARSSGSKGKARADDTLLSDDSSDDDDDGGGCGGWARAGAFEEGWAGAGEEAWAQGVGRDDWQGSGGGKRMVDISLACRYLAGQCQVRMGLFPAALEMLGASNPFRHAPSSGAALPADGGFKLEASMCLLRGHVHLRLGNTPLAKEAFVEALALDVRCFDAFQALVGGEMLGVDEEWDLIQNLCYKEQTDDCADFIRLVYTVRLKKFKHLREITRARKALVREYAMGVNADVLFGRADALYAQYRWAECYAVTSRILAAYPSHSATLPLHLACMHHLPRLRSSLFLLAHTLADQAPDEASSWYAVGLWYYTGERWGEARRFFGKASLMDPRFGAAWIAFAHSFAMEKEHDQAITAYSTAARLFQGSHLPMLHIGMEHLQLQNVDIAAGHFESAKEACDTDPLLWNEMGVVSFSRGEFEKAVTEFTRALDAAEVMQGSPAVWAPTHLNLGHALRKTQRYEDALKAYDEALQLDPVCDGAFAGRGLVHQMRGEWNEAIECYHEALSLNPQSTHATTLLNLALSGAIDLLGPLRAIPPLPADPLHTAQHVRASGAGVGDVSGAGGGYADSTQGALEDGSTMEIED